MIRICNRTIEYSFYLLFTLVPLILTPFNYELFEFNKMLLTYFLTTIIVGCWLIKMVLSKKIIFKRTFLDFPLFLFFLSQFISTLFSIDHHTSLFGYYSRLNGGLLSTICYLLLYYAFVANMTKKTALSLIRYSLFTATIISIYGILEHFGIDAQYWVQDVKNRVFSTLGQPNWLAAYLVGLIPLVWALSLNKQNPFILNTSYLILYTCLLFTKSRSGFLGFLTAFSLFWLLTLINIKNRRQVLNRFLFFAFSTLFLSLVIGTPFTPRASQIYKKFTKITPSPIQTTSKPKPQPGGTPSGEIRKIVWRGAIKIFQHHPLLGTGPETFAYSYYWYRPREHNDTSEWDFLYNKAHNEYLNYLATTGIFGLGSYLLVIAAFIGWNLKKIRQTPKARCYALLSGYSGLLAAHFFGFSVVITNLFFFLFPALALVLYQDTKKKLTLKQTKSNWNSSLTIILILFSLFIINYSLLKYWYADTLFAKAKKETKAGNVVEAFQHLQKAVKIRKEPLYYNELANASSVLSVLLQQQKEATAASQMAQFSIEQSDKALKISPYNLNYWKTRTKMFYNLGQVNSDYYQKALKTLLQASKLAPTDAKIFYNLSVLYRYLGEKQKAMETLKKTLKLKPDYPAAQKKLKEWSQN